MATDRYRLPDEEVDIFSAVRLVNRLWENGNDDGTLTVEGSRMLSHMTMRLYDRWIHLVMQLNGDIYSPVKGEQP